MANSSQARKRARQAELRRQRNASARSRMRTFVKRAEKALSGGNQPEAQAALKVAETALDRAAHRGLVHPNLAARKKSRLHARLRALA